MIVLLVHVSQRKLWHGALGNESLYVKRFAIGIVCYNKIEGGSGGFPPEKWLYQSTIVGGWSIICVTKGVEPPNPPILRALV